MFCFLGPSLRGSESSIQKLMEIFTSCLAIVAAAVFTLSTLCFKSFLCSKDEKIKKPCSS